jgi:hypothetical protein
MTKTHASPKLKLNREHLRRLDARVLAGVEGAGYTQWCNSGSCPTTPSGLAC